jgi:hypothetical protein
MHLTLRKVIPIPGLYPGGSGPPLKRDGKVWFIGRGSRDRGMMSDGREEKGIEEGKDLNTKDNEL